MRRSAAWRRKLCGTPAAHSAIVFAPECECARGNVRGSEKGGADCDGYVGKLDGAYEAYEEGEGGTQFVFFFFNSFI